MDGKSTWYATMLGLSWSGIPMMLLNDNGFAVTTYDGTWPNMGLFIWALLGGAGWPWLIYMMMWHDLFNPVPAAAYTLKGYTFYGL